VEAPGVIEQLLAGGDLAGEAKRQQNGREDDAAEAAPERIGPKKEWERG
jgi:hypothetical protein